MIGSRKYQRDSGSCIMNPLMWQNIITRELDEFVACLFEGEEWFFPFTRTQQNLGIL